MDLCVYPLNLIGFESNQVSERHAAAWAHTAMSCVYAMKMCYVHEATVTVMHTAADFLKLRHPKSAFSLKEIIRLLSI